MDDLEKRLASLRARAEQARAARARAEQQHAIAQDRVTTVTEEMREKFGVVSVAEAQEVLARMEVELNDAAVKAEALLGEAASA